MLEFEGVMKEIVKKAKKRNKKIVLPESEDLRILQAANVTVKEKIADIVLVGNSEEIFKICQKNNITLEPEIEIIEPIKDENYVNFVNSFYNLRKHKGMTLEQSYEILKDKLYYATMLVKESIVDGMVCGASHSTPDALRPALQIIKAKDGINIVSAFFLMDTKKKELGSNGQFIFADCGLVERPSQKDLYDIVKASVESFRILIPSDTPKVAMLSYSTKGNTKNESDIKMGDVAKKFQSENISFEIDGQLQLDTAIIPEVAKLKLPESSVAGKANILIFPDLQSGNIGYKLVQRFSDALAFGPITQGLKRPVNDLSRGCSVEEIVGTIAITCLQA